jgi:phenylalanine-4-hydroxylase
VHRSTITTQHSLSFVFSFDCYCSTLEQLLDTMYKVEATAPLHSTTKMESEKRRISLIFSVEDRVGALDDCLAALKELQISLTRIESRPSRTSDWDYDFFVDFISENGHQVDKVVQRLRPLTKSVRLVGNSSISSTTSSLKSQTPWFPRKITDLDGFAEKVLEMGEELSSDHPGAQDVAYRQRRAEITRIARSYRRQVQEVQLQ